MPAWNEPRELQRDIQVFTKFCVFWLGLYIWEFLTSFKPDLDILTGRRPFRPAQVAYFCCRYSVLALLIGVNVAMEATTRINCEALYVFNNLALGCTLGTSSLLLMLRTVAVWSFDKRIMVLLFLLSLGHWAIIFRDVIVTHASWNDEAGTCAVDRLYNQWLAVEFIYTMVLDFIILCVTTWGLVVHLPLKSDIRNLLLRDGLIYFIVAFAANAVPAIVMLCNLNPVMDFMFTPFAATLSAIVATRSVRRLTHALENSTTTRKPSKYTTAEFQSPLGPPSYRKPCGIKSSMLDFSRDTSSLPSPPPSAHLDYRHNQDEKFTIARNARVGENQGDIFPSRDGAGPFKFDNLEQTDSLTGGGNERVTLDLPLQVLLSNLHEDNMTHTDDLASDNYHHLSTKSSSVRISVADLQLDEFRGVTGDSVLTAVHEPASKNTHDHMV